MSTPTAIPSTSGVSELPSLKFTASCSGTNATMRAPSASTMIPALALKPARRKCKYHATLLDHNWSTRLTQCKEAEDLNPSHRIKLQPTGLGTRSSNMRRRCKQENLIRGGSGKWHPEGLKASYEGLFTRTGITDTSDQHRILRSEEGATSPQRRNPWFAVTSLYAPLTRTFGDRSASSARQFCDRDAARVHITSDDRADAPRQCSYPPAGSVARVRGPLFKAY